MSASKTANLLQEAFALHQRGALAEAAARYAKVLRADPANADAHYYMAMISCQQGRFGEGAERARKSLAANPRHAPALILLGRASGALGQRQEALASFERAIALAPDLAEAHAHRADILSGLGRNAEAIDSYDRAVALAPNFFGGWFNRGVALVAIGRQQDAIASFDRAIAGKPDFTPAHLLRAKVLTDLHRYDEALAGLDKLRTVAPNLAEGWLGRCNVLFEVKRYEEAAAACDRALALKPDLAEAWLARGNILNEQKRLQEALTAFDRALALNPDLVGAHQGRGNAFIGLKRPGDALAAYDKALAIWPDFVTAKLGRGNALCELNLNEEAVADFQNALAIKPDCAEARFGACFAELPIVYSNAEEILPRRGAYERKLRALCDDVEAGRVPGDLPKALEFKQPFYLAYQGYNDRELERLYGSMACRIMRRKYPDAPLPPPPSPGEPVRVGIVSSFFYNHPNWKTPIKGWISQLDRGRFKVFGYHIGTERDGQTDFAAAICDRFVQRTLSVEGWRREILADAPHVLIYPGLFMDEMSAPLAAQRLAPVQCNSWGHPDTSGMPTVDYYLSSDLMEPPQAAEHYSEQLVRLPNLSVYYEPVETEPCAVERAQLGLRADAVVFWCGQMLYKYLPQYDQVFTRIATQVENCQFVFFRHRGDRITSLFQERLERTFAAAGLNAAEYCVLLPPRSQSEYVATFGQCEVVLDSIGWSGCNSTLEGLPHDLPIVTTPGAFMRGRHTAAILRMMDVTETIAETIDDYVALAARLANNPDERHALSRKVAANKHRLYRDRACISALEEFLDRAVRQPGRAP